MANQEERRQVVVELGGCIRVGFAGEALPRVTVPAYESSGETWTQTTQVETRMTQDGDEEGVLQSIFNQQTRGFDFEDGVHSVHKLHTLLTREITQMLPADANPPLDYFFVVPPCATDSMRERLATLSLDVMRGQGLFITQSPITNLYSVGLTSGVSVDVGSRGTTIGIVSRGVHVDKYTVLGKYGGQFLTDRVKADVGDEVLCKAEQALVGWKLNPKNSWYHAFRAAEKIKERHSFVSAKPTEDDIKSFLGTKTDITPPQRDVASLPDGTPISVGEPALAACTLLCSPTIHGSIPNLLRSAVNSYNDSSGSAIDPTSLLESALVISGGVTLTPGFLQHLFTALMASFPAQRLQKPIYHVSSEERRASPWIGGTIAASHIPLGTFISKDTYDEQGARCVHTHCPA